MISILKHVWKETKGERERERLRGREKVGEKKVNKDRHRKTRRDKISDDVLHDPCGAYA